MDKKFSNLGLNNGVLPMGYTTEEALAQFRENLSKLPKRTGITEVERIRLEVQARRLSGENPTNS